MDLEKVIKNLFDSLAFKLDTSPSSSLTQEFLSAAGRFENFILFQFYHFFQFRKLHLKKKDPSIEDILEKMSTFGLELDHIDKH